MRKKYEFTPASRRFFSPGAAGMKRSAGALLGLASLLFLAPGAQAGSLLRNYGGPLGFGSNTLPANDDGSTSELNLPFPVNYFGTTYNSIWVNNNGNLTFDRPQSTFTPSAFPGTRPMLAPYWADVDTRVNNAPNGIVYYTAPDPNTFVATWPLVGYYNRNTDRLNSFQVIIGRTPGDTSGNWYAQYRYEQLQWTVGDVSGNNHAQAGYDAGDQVNYFTIPGSGDEAAVRQLVTTSNTGQPGVWQFSFTAGGQPPGSTPENPFLPIVVDGQFQGTSKNRA